MITFPNCKINLGLHITAKRADGYHDLETVFFPVPFKDAIEVVQENDPQTTTHILRRSPFGHYSFSGALIEGDVENNLCLKAYHLIKKDFPFLPVIKMHLHKTIPLGAGLGGGSADGAFMLKLINEKFQLGISTEQLISYAEQLGSDCPFFILNKPCYATGRGEKMEEINFSLSGYKIVVVHPGIHINTGWAFSKITPSVPGKSIKEIINQPVSAWKDELKNDFETPVFSQYPEIKNIKDRLYNAGAIYSSMTGSGSAVFGIFEKEKNIQLNYPKNYLVKIAHCQ